MAAEVGVDPELALNRSPGMAWIFAKVQVLAAVQREADDRAVPHGGLFADVYERDLRCGTSVVGRMSVWFLLTFADSETE